MIDDIINFLDIKESGIRILDTRIEKGTTKVIALDKRPITHYCEHCGYRMYSKGIYKRRVNHPVLQDGFTLVLEIHQRRWKCSNKDCGISETDDFSFVEKHRRNTNISDLLIVEAFKDSQMTARAIARRFNVSDSHVIRTFARYVDMPRRQLSEAISIDEVFLNIHHGYKYALVIQDFLNGEPIDLLKSRRQEITEPYFQSIPIKERERVKYVISDMYRSYLRYAGVYFPNAVSVIDSFHVIQAINFEILKYIRTVIKRVDRKDHEEYELRCERFLRKIEFKHSTDYLVIKKYYKLILKNAKDIKWQTTPKYDPRLKRLMTTQDYFEWMYKIEPKLRDLRALKEDYIAFNEAYAGKPTLARANLPKIIEKYRRCPYRIFNEIAELLQENFDAIVMSFTIVEKYSKDKVRLSNGPIESLNRITKDMKRNSRGFRNFEYIRNRFLFSQRKNAQILGAPKRLEDTYLKTYLPHLKEEDIYFYDEDMEDDWEAFKDEE